MQMLPYFSSKTSSALALLLPCLSFTALITHLYRSKSHFCPSFSLKFPGHVNSARVPMDSLSPDVSVSIDSVAKDLKNQSFRSNNNESFDLSHDTKKVGLKLEDLQWDHSFVRQLPGDPRTDPIPRKVLHACYTNVFPSPEVGKPQLVA